MHTADEERIRELTEELASHQSLLQERTLAVESVTAKLNEALRSAEFSVLERQRIEETLKAQLAAQQSQMDQLNAQILTLTEEMNAAVQNADLQTCEKKELCEQLSMKQSDLDELHVQVKSLTEQLNAAVLDADLRGREREESGAQFVTKLHEIDTLTEQVKLLNEQLSAATQSADLRGIENERLTTELATKQIQLDELSCQVHSLTEQMNAAIQNADLLANEKEKLEAQLSSKQSDLDDLNAKFKSLTEQLNAAVLNTELEANKDQLNTPLTANQNQVDTLNAQVTSLTDQLNTLRHADLQASEKDKSFYSTNTGEHASPATIVESLTKKLNDAMRIAKSNTAEKLEVEVLYSQLQAQHKITLATLVARDSSLEELTQLRSALQDEMQKKIDRLRDAEDKLLAEQSVVDSLRKQIEQLTEDNERERCEHEAKMEQLTSDLANTNTTLVATNERIQSITAELENLKPRNTELVSQITELHSQLTTLNAELHESRNQAALYIQLADERLNAIEQLQVQLADTANMVAESSAANQALISQNEELKDSSRMQLETMQLLREELDAKIQQLELVTDRLKAREQCNAELTEVNSTLSEQVATIKSELEKLSSEKSDEIVLLKDEVSAKVQQLQSVNKLLAAAQLSAEESRTQCAAMAEQLSLANEKNTTLANQVRCAGAAAEQQKQTMIFKDERILQLEAECDKVTSQLHALKHESAELERKFEDERTQRTELEVERRDRFAQQKEFIDQIKRDASQIAERFAGVFELEVELPQMDLNANESSDRYACRLLKFIQEQLTDKEDIYNEKNRVSRLCDDADEDLCRMQNELRKVSTICTQQEAELTKLKALGAPPL